MTLRVVMFAVSAFLLSSPAWASTSSCPDQNNSTDGCSTTNSQFINVFTPVGAMLSFEFNTSASHGSGPFGTVLLTQLSDTQVGVTVTLNNTLFPGIGFVNASGKEALDFNLNLPGTPGLTVTNLTPGFSFPGVQLDAPPYGTFMYGVHCDVCGNGGSNPHPGPLVFDVSLTGGGNLSILNFNANSAGAFFATDIFANGATFDVAAELPEPGTFWLMGGALALLGLFALRRNKAVA
ncbi:MAG TPA: PEP-CTERM sorting domain-containing protein [Bryobacteraceae bacterium]|nr:PEP-CTERM sorting domain-containing protein [Bryobacteraceae bacterium]